MILSTTPTLEGHAIREYKGLVTGEAIVAANFIRDFFAGIRDVIGGRSSSYEKVLKQSKEDSLKEMGERAAKLGANAVVGIGFEVQVIGKSMLIVASSGTAVVCD